MKKELSGIAGKYQIRLMILFGSTAQGRMHKESDIDIAIQTEKPLSVRNELSLRSDLSRIFKREIDIVNIPASSPLLSGQIVKHGKLLYGSKREFNSMLIHEAKHFFDFEPYFRLREKIIPQSLSRIYA